MKFNIFRIYILMSIRNIEIKSPKADDSPKDSPYYVKDIKKEVLQRLGVDYSNINNLYTINNKKLDKYIIDFKKDIENEINTLYKLYTIGDNDELINKEFEKHINNINKYTEFIVKTVSVGC